MRVKGQAEMFSAECGPLEREGLRIKTGRGGRGGEKDVKNFADTGGPWNNDLGVTRIMGKNG